MIDSQNLAFATSHFVLELLPFDETKSSESTKTCISRGITLHTVVALFNCGICCKS